MRKLIKNGEKNKPAHNERFGASGAVTRPSGSEDFQVLYLVSSVVKAPPSQSRWDVGRKRRTVQRDTDNETRKK